MDFQLTLDFGLAIDLSVDSSNLMFVRRVNYTTLNFSRVTMLYLWTLGLSQIRFNSVGLIPREDLLYFQDFSIIRFTKLDYSTDNFTINT